MGTQEGAVSRIPFTPPPAAGTAATGLASVGAAVLGACGGGGGGPDPIAAAPLSREQAARLLGSAAFGGTAADIEAVRSLGVDGWLAQQYAAPRSTGHVEWMRANGYEVSPNPDFIDRPAVIRSVWRKLVSSPDVLRQRVTLALSEIFVISLTPVTLPYRGFACAAFWDILEANAFGNWRDLLLQVSTSPAMGSYLSFINNKKAGANGSMPDENYAREVMQLFSIGLLQLNADGTPVLAGGSPVPTYTQADVTQLARVFTGWRLDSTARARPADAVTRPMVNVAGDHESGSSTFLDQTIPAGTDGPTSLQLTIDALMRQPSMAPFIGRQLIQRLVTSHPSPGYVQRVATAFAGNGGSTRGDLKATLTAVLTDPEARGEASLADPAHGKLREPLQRFLQFARTFGLVSGDDSWNIGDLSNPATALGQSPLRSPSVFNFFRPGYVPPATELAVRGLTAPEFQITNETSVAGYLNFMQRVVASGIAGMTPDYGAITPLASDPAALLAELNVLLAAGQLPAPTVARLAAAVGSIDGSTAAGLDRRVRAALTLVLAAPDYIVQK